jgi:cation diffusion facilitator family transporter
MTNNAKENLRLQSWICGVGVVLFIIKIIAWYITDSVAILTDALESTVNVVSGFIGLYSLYLSAQPKDQNHPYGHGKVEFISAGIEGALITLAGFIIIYEACLNIFHPHNISQLDYGIALVIVSAIVNYVVGFFAIKKGEKNKSLALVASGKHLQTDTYSTIGIVVGLILMYFTNWAWIDSATAILFALLIITSGIKIVRSSIAGVMDETDTELLEEVIDYLNKHRPFTWIDLHNLRIIKYGSILHLDCHLTVPWYFNVHEAHNQIEHLGTLVRNKYGEQVELFVHTDGCLDFSCAICQITDCKERKTSFVKKIEWTLSNVSTDSKHRASTE